MNDDDHSFSKHSEHKSLTCQERQSVCFRLPTVVHDCGAQNHRMSLFARSIEVHIHGAQRSQGKKGGSKWCWTLQFAWHSPYTTSSRARQPFGQCTSTIRPGAPRPARMKATSGRFLDEHHRCNNSSRKTSVHQCDKSHVAINIVQIIDQSMRFLSFLNCVRCCANFSLISYSYSCFQELRRSDFINQVRVYRPSLILHTKK